MAGVKNDGVMIPNYLQMYFGHRLVQAAPTELNIISTLTEINEHNLLVL